MHSRCVEFTEKFVNLPPMVSIRKLVERIIACSLITFVAWWLGALSDSFGLFMAVVLGLIWALLVVWPFCGWMGTMLGSIISPQEKWDHDQMPQYSVPESKIKQGKYDEAITLFRELSEKYPAEITPHLRIGDIMFEQKGDREAAIQEFEVAVTKAQTVEALMFVTIRLVDWYTLENPRSDKALKLLREVQRQFPNTKQSKIAEKRARTILDFKFEETT